MARSRWGDLLPLHRRSFVSLAGLTLVATGCGASSTTAAAEPATLAGLAPGTQLPVGRVVSVHAPHYGAIPVILETADGERFQVDVMARDPAVDPPAGTERLAVYVVNHGDGATATDEAQGLSAMAFAAALGEVDASTLPDLLTMSQRHARFPDVSLRVPLG
jgi:hypothetical protein